MIKQKWTRAQGIPPAIITVDPDGEDLVIEAKKHLRILGGNLQCNLSWQAHLSTGEKALLPVIHQKLGALRYMGRYLPRASRQTLATGMIISRINYLIQVWGGTEVKYLKKVQTVLNDAARFVTGMHRRTSTLHLMTSCNWLYAHELSKYHAMIAMWTLTRRGIPQYLRERIIIDDNWLLTTDPARIQNTLSSYRWWEFVFGMLSMMNYVSIIHFHPSRENLRSGSLIVGLEQDLYQMTRSRCRTRTRTRIRTWTRTWIQNHWYSVLSDRAGTCQLSI